MLYTIIQVDTNHLICKVMNLLFVFLKVFDPDRSKFACLFLSFTLSEDSAFSIRDSKSSILYYTSPAVHEHNLCQYELWYLADNVHVYQTLKASLFS